MDREKLLPPGPHHRTEGWGGQEDVADGVAMAALPPCVVITCSNGAKEVERKVCVWGRREQEHGEERGPRRGLGTSPHFELRRAGCVLACVWEPEMLGVVYFWHACVCVCVRSTAGKQEVTDPSWVLGMTTLSVSGTSCPKLLPAPDSPSRVYVCHGSVTACLPHAHPLLHCRGQLSSDLYFDPLGGGAELGKEEE